MDFSYENNGPTRRAYRWEDMVGTFA
jgi:hypothetical protein